MARVHVAVTGANSAVGTALLTQLVDQDDMRAVAAVRHQKALAGLPRAPHITPAVISYDCPDSLSAALTGAGCVVHLAGILLESKTSDYQTANVGTTRALVAASTAAAVDHIVFISSLGADPSSPNGYFRSKGEAERVVGDSGIDATIVRTPLLLGPDTAGGVRSCGWPLRNRSESWVAGLTCCARSTSTISAALSSDAVASRRPA